MEKYCDENDLILNTHHKTKYMTFNETGRLIRTNICFQIIKVETVRSFKYLEFLITPSGEIKSGLDDLRLRAMKAFFKLKRSLGTSFHTHIDTTLHLLDTLIKPILLYASDFWGGLKPPQDNPIEKFHRMACRYILGVQKYTTNIGVLLELGRIPMQIFAVKAAVKNWERIRLGNANVNLLKSHKDSVDEDLPWINNIKHILDTNGMTWAHANQYDDKLPFIHKKLFQNLTDSFHQEAFSTIQNPASKLRTYGLLKKERGTEKYLYELKNPNNRRSLTKFRLSNHVLNIEKGRHVKLKKGDKDHTPHQRCPFCPNKIESEIHFLISCPAYNLRRNVLFASAKTEHPPFEYYTETEKFQYLMSEEKSRLTSKFVVDLFDARKKLLEQEI